MKYGLMVGSPEFLLSEKLSEESKDACRKKLSSMLPKLLALESFRGKLPAKIVITLEESKSNITRANKIIPAMLPFSIPDLCFVIGLRSGTAED